jgi:PAS domain S-box-containing protein
MLGYKPDDQPSHTNAWKDLIHPADREATLLANMECIENRRDSFEIELRMRTKAGDWRWIQSRGKAVARDASGRALRLIGTHTDISAHKQVEQALRTSEEHFSKSFRSSPVPTSITSLSDGRVIDANTSMLELLGFNLEEVLGHTTQELHIWVNEEDRAITIQMLRDGKPVRGFETRLRTKSGELRDALISFEVIESGGELRLLSNVFDITERKRVEEALRASQSRMNTIFELVGIALAVTDLQGRWLETNRHFQQVLGYTMDELRNMSYREIVHPDQAEMTMQGMLDLIAGKIDSWQSEILRSCKRISPRFDFLRFETE